MTGSRFIFKGLRDQDVQHIKSLEGVDIAWIEEAYPGYSSSDQYGNFGGTIYPTGQTEKDRLREICDLSGNVREWTTEKYLGTDTTTSTSSKNSKNKNKNVTENVIMRVVRGGSASLSRTPMSRIGYDENTFDVFDDAYK